VLLVRLICALGAKPQSKKKAIFQSKFIKTGLLKRGGRGLEGSQLHRYPSGAAPEGASIYI
jgi:hypothetical protein